MSERRQVHRHFIAGSSGNGEAWHAFVLWVESLPGRLVAGPQPWPPNDPSTRVVCAVTVEEEQ